MGSEGDLILLDRWGGYCRYVGNKKGVPTIVPTTVWVGYVPEKKRFLDR